MDMNKFYELVKTRQSVRKYNPNKKVEKEKIERCVEAARLAPSASNSQPWTFIVIDEPDLKRKVANATFSNTVSFNKFTLDAPVLVAVVTEKSKLMAQMGNFLKNQQYNLIDIGIAVEHFCLQATEESLGTCIMASSDEKKIKKLLNVPSKKRINIVMSLGYASDEDNLRDKIRKPFESIIRYNSY